MIEHNGMITLCLVIFSYICESQTFYTLIPQHYNLTLFISS